MKQLRILIVSAVILAAFALLIHADQNARAKSHAVPPTAATVGAGDWIADTGDAIRLRHDGTGTSTHTANGEVHHCDFDWSCDGSLLTIKNFPNVLGSFMAHETGLATATFPVDKVSDNTFVFRHDGITVTLTTNDGVDRPLPTIQNGG